MSVPTLDLPGGFKFPIIGLGTAKGGEAEIENAIDAALENGYRHIDTAHSYNNEVAIGNVLKKWISSGRIKREDLFIVSKFPPYAVTIDRVEEYLLESLKRLQLDYVDMYLVQFPVLLERLQLENSFAGQIPHTTEITKLWEKMEEQVDAGKAKTIGLSNFNVSQIKRIMKTARIKPAAIQMEIHLYLQNKELVEYSQKNGIAVVAFSPLGAPGVASYSEEYGLPSKLIQDPTVATLAEKYNKTPAQILLRFLIQRNIVVIPKSNNPSRQKENLDVFDFEIIKSDFHKLRRSNIGEKARLSYAYPHPPSCATHPEWPYKNPGVYYGANSVRPHSRKPASV